MVPIFLLKINALNIVDSINIITTVYAGAITVVEIKHKERKQSVTFIPEHSLNSLLVYDRMSVSKIT